MVLFTIETKSKIITYPGYGGSDLYVFVKISA